MKSFQRETQAGRQVDAAALSHMQAEKAQLLKATEQRKLRLIGLLDTLDMRSPSEIFVRGTLFPGAVIESHGRRWETRTEKNMITLFSDQAQGSIVERL